MENSLGIDLSNVVVCPKKERAAKAALVAESVISFSSGFRN